MGELNGMILAQNANGVFGFWVTILVIRYEKIIGMVIGNIKLCASCGSSFTTLPTAANNAE
jgi:hypothetical protein